ncbi:MAG TPA: alpha/beta fold hydrolase [Acidimicrobiales bacterium]|nr:alpha/beta fold hydrolase [Acidimicrobiales bacterium]
METLPHVLLVHGFASSFAHGWQQNDWTDLLADAGREVVPIDLPGHGTSAPTTDPVAYADVPGALAATLAPHAPVDAVGFSTGARLLLDLAAEDAGRLRKLVLIGVPFPGFPITNPDFALAIGLGGALAIGETLVPPLMVPEALGVQLFTVLTPQEALAGVIDDIEALVADGALTGGYAQGLTRPLETAIRSLDGGNADAACDQLDGVSDRSIPGSILDAGSAGDLIARVEAVEAHLGCT